MNVWTAVVAIVIHNWFMLLGVAVLAVGLALIIKTALRSASQGAAEYPDE